MRTVAHTTINRRTGAEMYPGSEKTHTDMGMHSSGIGVDRLSASCELERYMFDSDTAHIVPNAPKVGFDIGYSGHKHPSKCTK
jgi:hypothetical protein